MAHPACGFAAHANLVLGLNELKGQRSAVRRTVSKSDPQAASLFLRKGR